MGERHIPHRHRATSMEARLGMVTRVPKILMVRYLGPIVAAASVMTGIAGVMTGIAAA